MRSSRLLPRFRRIARARASVDEQDFESRLVWLLGSPRSGSTWLTKLLAEHPLIAAIKEPLIGDHLGPFLCDRPGVRASSLDAGNFTTRRVRHGARDYFFADEFTDTWQPLLGRLIRERFLAHARRHFPSEVRSRGLVVIQEPNGSQAADMIMGALPRSKLLFLLRDGRDVVDSELAAAAPDSWVSRAFPLFTGIEPADRESHAEQVAYKWLWRTEIVQEAFAAHSGPKHLVRYESLRSDPAGELSTMFDWLGLTVTGEELARWVDRNDFERQPARGPSEFTRAARPGMWRESLSTGEQRTIRPVLATKLRELGYDAWPDAGSEH